MFAKDYVPEKPFPNFKWKWASLQCTEGLNDPVVLLGVLFRMRKLEPLNLKYSSPEFAREMMEFSNAIEDSVTDVNLAGRTGKRNLIRNSGQYWKAVGLIKPETRGKIELTRFGQLVADHEISQTEFAAITVQTLRLPNPAIQQRNECNEWASHGLLLRPLQLLLDIISKLYESDSREGYITPAELQKIIIPLSGCKAELQDYVNFVLWHRRGDISLIGWPECCPEANDKRIAREFLLFLSNYGYLNCTGTTRADEKYYVNEAILDEIKEIIGNRNQDGSLLRALEAIRTTEVIAEVERKRVHLTKTARPNQARFRKEVLKACQRCIITNVTMPEILEAAHIKPFKYKGEDSIANGFAMRTDIHTLFDTGHLRISVDGEIELSPRARMDYGATIPPRIVIPEFINRDFLKWRWDNYNGL